MKDFNLDGPAGSETAARAARLSRRAVIGAAAWTVPAVITTAASPAFAASAGTKALAFDRASATMVLGRAIQLTLTLTGAGPAGDEEVLLELTGGFSIAGATSTVITVATPGAAPLTITGPAGTEATGAITATLTSAPEVIATAALLAVRGNLTFWGNNGHGSAGTNPPTISGNNGIAFVQSTSLTDYATMIGGGFDNMIATVDTGQTFVAGRNTTDYSLGVGIGTDFDQPTYVRAAKAPGPYLANTVYLPSGTVWGTSWAVTSDGSVWAAGYNVGNFLAASPGKIVSGRVQQWLPVGDLIPRAAGEKFVKATLSAETGGAMVFLTDKGTAYAAGENATGKTAQGTTTGSTTGARILRDGGVPLDGVIDVALGHRHLLAVTDDGKLWGAGQDNYGSLLGRTGTSTTLTQIPVPDGKRAARVYATVFRTFVLMTDGTVYASGQNLYGELGVRLDAERVTTLRPMVITTPETGRVVKIAPAFTSTLFLMDNGNVYFSGSNNVGGSGVSGSNWGVNLTWPKLVPLAGPAFDIAVTGSSSTSYAALLHAR